MTIRTVVRHVSTALCAAVVLFGAAIYLTGIRIHVVQSPSMRPSVPPNAVVAVRPTRVDNVKVGDVISFADPNTSGRTILHRVVAVTDTNRGRVLRTKGDANPAPDHFAVSDLELHGRSVAVVPRGGELARLMVDERAPFVLVGVPLVIWLSTFTAGALRSRKMLEKGYAR